MKHATLLLGLCVGLVSPTFGQFTDTFSSTVSGRWGTVTTTTVGPPSTGSSSVSLAQDNGNSRVDWQLTLSSTSASDHRYLPLQSHGGTYDADWTVELALVNTFSGSSGLGQSTQLGLMVFNTTGMTTAGSEDYVKLVLVRASDDYSTAGTTGNVFHYGVHSNGSSSAISTATALTSTTLKLVYTASSHTIATYYDNTLLTTYGIAGSGGTTNQDWGMSSGGTFAIGIYGQAGTDSDGTGFTLAAGTAYADTLVATGLGTAVPEPGAYALALGALALGCVVLHRRNTRTLP